MRRKIASMASTLALATSALVMAPGTASAQERPRCSHPVITPGTILWPPNHKFHLITISVPDDQNDPVTTTITFVSQDEPVNDRGDGNTAPDAQRVSRSDQILLRAERSGRGDGRVYRVSFKAVDSKGNRCVGEAFIGVPHDMGKGRLPIDSGQRYNSFATG